MQLLVGGLDCKNDGSTGPGRITPKLHREKTGPVGGNGSHEHILLVTAAFELIVTEGGPTELMHVTEFIRCNASLKVVLYIRSVLRDYHFNSLNSLT